MSKENQEQKRGKLQWRTYKQLKSVHKNNEELAINYVLDRYPNERHKNLVPDHTAKTFVWRAKQNL